MSNLRCRPGVEILSHEELHSLTLIPQCQPLASALLSPVILEL